ncbi:MAG: rRNA maturation RNAse YbeY [Armatimonadetes bacterium]|nr:rRNA maturation RNAse YbeY [Armatimonadota bacterium]
MAVTVQVRRPGISATRLRKIVARVMKREGASKRSGISIVLVGDPAMRWLNRRHLGKDRVTDVLAFPLFERTKAGRRMPKVERPSQLGEVVRRLCRSRTNSGRRGRSPGAHRDRAPGRTRGPASPGLR